MWFKNITLLTLLATFSVDGPDSWEANPWVWVVEFRRIGQSLIAEGAK